MKSLSFRNSSKRIESIINHYQMPETEEGSSYYDEDLQFSTFRSED
jgi:hypothetical protein